MEMKVAVVTQGLLLFKGWTLLHKILKFNVIKSPLDSDADGVISSK